MQAIALETPRVVAAVVGEILFEIGEFFPLFVPLSHLLIGGLISPQHHPYIGFLVPSGHSICIHKSEQSDPSETP